MKLWPDIDDEISREWGKHLADSIWHGDRSADYELEYPIPPERKRAVRNYAAFVLKERRKLHGS